VRVKIEFFGVARLKAGASEITLELNSYQATLGDVLRETGLRLPGWASTCLVDGELSAGYLANIDGEQFVREPSHPVLHGQSVLILAADAGG